MVKKTNQNEKKAIYWLMNATEEKRYEHTIHCIADTETLFLATNSTIREKNIIVWPETAREILLKECIEVTLEDFVEQYLKELIYNNFTILVFPTEKNNWMNCIHTDILTFINDLNASLEDFGETIDTNQFSIIDL